MNRIIAVFLLFPIFIISCKGPFIPDVFSFSIPDAPEGQIGFAEAGTNGYLYYAGNILLPEGIYSGEIIINPSGTIEYIGQSAKELSVYNNASKIICERGLALPGFIDGRRHSTYAVNEPFPDNPNGGNIRYDHRHEWRLGLSGKIKLTFNSETYSTLWDEVVMIMAGVTSVNDSSGSLNMVRNLKDLEGHFDTYPLGDSAGYMTTTLNDYADFPLPSNYNRYYSGVAAEGICSEARNEFLSLADDTHDSILKNNAVIISGAALKPEDYQAMAESGTSLVWTPRSDLFLYGNTALVTAFAGYGGNIALGSVWTSSGSYNLLLELKRAKYFNDTYLNGYFSDQELINMATINGARAFGLDNDLGSLEVGKWGDLTIFAFNKDNPYDSVLKADQEDIALVVKAGEVLYGNTYFTDTLVSDTLLSEIMDVNGSEKRIFLEKKTGNTISDLEASASSVINHIPFVFDKTEADREIFPARSNTYSGLGYAVTTYSGLITTEDRDGDGIANDLDNSPDIFNPLRLVDEGIQPVVE